MRHEGAWWYHAELKTQMGFAHWNVPYIFFAPQRGAANRRRGCSMVPLCGTRYRGDAPPIFFLRHQKENAPCTVEKKKCQG